MPLDTYANLQASILSWLARPGDPLVSPSIPDIITLFEREADRRLKVAGAEKRVSLTAISAAVALPADFGQLRLATSGGVILTYVTPMQLPDGGGPPSHYTIVGNEMRLGPSPSATCTIEIVYQSGVPPLSDTNTTNWLLAQHPDCYLFGSLVEAESFIGSDERIPLWAQRREAAFASIESADRKARWGGAPLSIRAEGVSGGNGTAAGDWTSVPPISTYPIPVANGGTGATTAPAALANLGAVAKAGDTMTGALGIGAAPGSMLSVNGNVSLPLNGYIAFPGPTIAASASNFALSGNAATTAVNVPSGGVLTLNTGNAERVRIDSVGNVGIGVTPTFKLNVDTMHASNLFDAVVKIRSAHATNGDYVMHVSGGLVGSDLTTRLINFQDAAGTAQGAITRNGTAAVTYGTTSDERLKDDITDTSIGLQELLQLKVRDYNYKRDDRQGHGLIAQEVQPIYPQAVCEGGDDPASEPWLIDYGRLTPLLIKAVQELSARLEALEGKPAEPVG